MCGIAGFINLDHAPASERELQRMTRTLAHRGPDGEGYYCRGPVGLGHRRLAILDLSDAGKQPMSYANNRYWITFNGEIYNFLELRQELESLGHRFVSQSDTEVILAAYVQWGEECQLKFNGMWAFAVWDNGEKSLFLSRDRFGVKPLHYHLSPKRFAFASEMKAFAALDEFVVEFDSEWVAVTLRASSSLEATEHCIIKGINRLPGGHCLTLRAGQSPQIRRWWHTLDHLETPPKTLGDQADRFRELFLDACRIRMRSDVPLGTALSGGLDSSSVLCGMTHIRKQTGDGERLAGDWQRAFVATYPGTVQDETEYAKLVVEHTGATGLYVEIKPSLVFDHLDDYLYKYEEIQDIHLGPWMVYKAMRDAGVVVSLDGHGGDESLAGYVSYPIEAMRLAIKRLQPRRALAMNQITQAITPAATPEPPPTLAGYVQRGMYYKSRKTVRNLLRLSPGLFRAARWVADAVHHKVHATARPRVGEWMSVGDGQLGTRYPNDPKPVGYDGVNCHLYRDFHYVVLPAILRNFDRLSMAHGVEIRAPLMDWRLVCYNFSLPGDSKLGNGFTKLVMREAMRGILPEPIRTRTSKIGFGNPLFDWLKGPLKSFVCDTAASGPFLESDIWNGPALRLDIENAYRAGNVSLLVRAWPFVHAARLVELFRQVRLMTDD